MTSMVLEHPGVLVGGGKGAVHWGVPVPGHRQGLGPSWASEAGKEAVLGVSTSSQLLWPPQSMPALRVAEMWLRGSHLVPPHRWLLVPRGHVSSLPAKAGAARLSCCVRKGGVACWLQHSSAAGGDGLTLRLMHELGKWLRHRLRAERGLTGARCSRWLSWRLRRGPWE